MRKIFNLNLFILSLIAIDISAAERSYKIELLVFAQDMPTTEVFEQTESQIYWPKYVSDLSSYNKASLQLNASYEKLLRSHKYHPLVHLAWGQTIKANSLGPAVRITNPEGTLDGFIQIQRGHLLHLKADFEYSVGTVIYHLNEKRRFKLNEIHYLDHPKFAVIARVSPIGD